MLDACEPTSGLENTSYLGNDLLGLFHRTEHQRAEDEGGGLRRKIQLFARKAAKVQLDSEVDRPALEQ